MSGSTFGPYADTEISESGFLNILKIRPVPKSDTDILYEITPSYTRRPDLLAHDMVEKIYGGYLPNVIWIL